MQAKFPFPSPWKINPRKKPAKRARKKPCRIEVIICKIFIYRKQPCPCHIQLLTYGLDILCPQFNTGIFAKAYHAVLSLVSLQISQGRQYNNTLSVRTCLLISLTT